MARREEMDPILAGYLSDAFDPTDAASTISLLRAAESRLFANVGGPWDEGAIELEGGFTVSPPQLQLSIENIVYMRDFCLEAECFSNN